MVYVGGYFTNAGGNANADMFAAYKDAVWYSLGGSTNVLYNAVHAIMKLNGTLYVGGLFTNAGGDPDADMIAKFDPAPNLTPTSTSFLTATPVTGQAIISGAWRWDGAGLSDGVYDFLFFDDVLVAAGSFLDGGGDPNADGVAQFGLNPPIGSTATFTPSITPTASTTSTPTATITPSRTSLPSSTPRLTRPPAPIALIPEGTITDTTPDFAWSMITGATQYRLQVFRQNRLVYSLLVPATSCNESVCVTTPTRTLAYSVYKWHVQAIAGPLQSPWTTYKTFRIVAP